MVVKVVKVVWVATGVKVVKVAMMVKVVKVAMMVMMVTMVRVENSEGLPCSGRCSPTARKRLTCSWQRRVST